MTRYYHGGHPGLRPGDLILPPDVTGTERTLSRYAVELGGPAHATRTDVVYFAADRDGREVARAHAAFHPDGALYQVAPTSGPEPDPDCSEPGLSWQCPAAAVLAVIDACVLFRTRSPERWLRLLHGRQ